MHDPRPRRSNRSDSSPLEPRLSTQGLVKPSPIQSKGVFSLGAATDDEGAETYRAKVKLDFHELYVRSPVPKIVQVSSAQHNQASVP